MKKASSKGFTLIELMIVVVIVAILAAIAFPSYQAHVTKTKRAEAQAALVLVSQAMERYKSANNFSYAGAVLGGANGVFTNQVPLEGGAAYYNLVLVSNATTFTINANAIGVQTGDGNLTITNTGVKTWDGRAGWK